MDGKFLGVDVKIKAFIEKRDGWKKDAPLLSTREDIEKALMLFVKPYMNIPIISPIMRSFKNLQVHEKHEIASKIDRIEIKLFYKEI